MADLEEMGYIIQPHTSAGRIPTDAGYRFYVDQLMDEKEEFAEVAKQERDTLLERVDRMEGALKAGCKGTGVQYQLCNDGNSTKL